MAAVGRVNNLGVQLPVHESSKSCRSMRRKFHLLGVIEVVLKYKHIGSAVSQLYSTDKKAVKNKVR